MILHGYSKIRGLILLISLSFSLYSLPSERINSLIGNRTHAISPDYIRKTYYQASARKAVLIKDQLATYSLPSCQKKFIKEEIAALAGYLNSIDHLVAQVQAGKSVRVTAHQELLKMYALYLPLFTRNACLKNKFELLMHNKRLRRIVVSPEWLMQYDLETLGQRRVPWMNEDALLKRSQGILYLTGAVAGVLTPCVGLLDQGIEAYAGLGALCISSLMSRRILEVLTHKCTRCVTLIEALHIRLDALAQFL